MQYKIGDKVQFNGRDSYAWTVESLLGNGREDVYGEIINKEPGMVRVALYAKKDRAPVSLSSFGLLSSRGDGWRFALDEIKPYQEEKV